jgi:phosphopantothenoylcysteine decarboxylase/phosphopantothenate--cysteine ligase
VDDAADLHVLLGVSGGIAAYKAVLVARQLIGAGATVDVVLTRGAEHFIGAATFEGITGRPVRADVWDDIHADTHVAVGRAADVALIYPATAHTLARLAGGLADDLLTTTLLAATCPLVVAPAMHTEMWLHPATQHNVEVLRSRGVTIIGPADGPLMGGDSGPGRVVEPDEAIAALQTALTSADGAGHPTDDLAGTTVVVTAGGTREPIDPVRFLGNRSSGRMGFALAAEAARRGANVELIAASAALPTPVGVTRTDVVTALQMRDAVLARVASADVIIKAAAVADFRPSDPATSKLKKDAGAPVIELVANPDILAELGAERGNARRPVLVGFAAETDDVEANGRAKLKRKGADLLVVNDVSDPQAGFEVDTNQVIILDRDGGRREVALTSKAEVAREIVDVVAARLGR